MFLTSSGMASPFALFCFRALSRSPKMLKIIENNYEPCMTESYSRL